MPILQFYTTLPSDKVPKNFQLKTAEILSQVLTDKPLDRIIVHLRTDQSIFAGNDPEGKQPNAYAVLRSIGSVTAEENRRTIDVLSKHVKQELNINNDQFRLLFIDLDPDLTAFKGQILTDLGL